MLSWLITNSAVQIKKTMKTTFCCLLLLTYVAKFINMSIDATIFQHFNCWSCQPARLPCCCHFLANWMLHMRSSTFLSTVFNLISFKCENLISIICSKVCCCILYDHTYEYILHSKMLPLLCVAQVVFGVWCWWCFEDYKS